MLSMWKAHHKCLLNLLFLIYEFETERHFGDWREQDNRLLFLAEIAFIVLPLQCLKMDYIP